MTIPYSVSNVHSMLCGMQTQTHLLRGPLEQIPLLEIGVRFDLVDSGWNTSPTHLQSAPSSRDKVTENIRSHQLLNPLPSEIAHSNGAHLPLVHELLHRSPGILERNVDDIDQPGFSIHRLIRCCRVPKRNRPMDQVEIDIVDLEIAECLIERPLDVFGFVVCVP